MSEGGTNRRQFLLGRSVTDEVSRRLEETRESLDQSQWNQLPTGAAAGKQANYLEQYCKNAMACEFEICFNLRQYQNSSSAAMTAFGLIDELEAQMTVYRDDSEISRLNQKAFENPIEVEARLYQLLCLGRSLHAETNGAFDLTSGSLSKVWGFEKRSGRLPTQETITAALACVGTEHLAFDDRQQTIGILHEGVKINLGGIGKGYALDRVGQLFQALEINDFIIHGGQSSLLAVGSSSDGALSKVPEGQSDSGWRVGVTHPNLPQARLAEVTLRGQALGTSGTARQGFFHQGKRYGHIIDPRSGWPAGHFLSTTAIAPTAAEADALATAFFVMTEEEVEGFCRHHPRVGAILISGVDKRSSHVQITTLNIADEDWTLTAPN